MEWNLNVEKKLNENFKKIISSKTYDRPKQPENVELFKCLGRMLTNDVRHTCEIKSTIVMPNLHLTRTGLFLLAKYT
jgi:hypothetical protein